MSLMSEMASMYDCGLEFIEHPPPYLNDLASSDYHFFQNLKQGVSCKHLCKWWRRHFCCGRLHKLPGGRPPHHWEPVIQAFLGNSIWKSEGNYVANLLAANSINTVRPCKAQNFSTTRRGTIFIEHTTVDVNTSTSLKKIPSSADMLLCTACRTLHTVWQSFASWCICFNF